MLVCLSSHGSGAKWGVVMVVVVMGVVVVVVVVVVVIVSGGAPGNQLGRYSAGVCGGEVGLRRGRFVGRRERDSGRSAGRVTVRPRDNFVAEVMVRFRTLVPLPLPPPCCSLLCCFGCDPPVSFHG